MADVIEECELAPPGTTAAVEALRARLAKALAKVAELESENRALRASRRAALEFLETGDLSEAKEWLGD